ncbi:MAG: hypothetical protein QXF12_04040 [Candidatus Aenigmatarchaeota archaeon]
MREVDLYVNLNLLPGVQIKIDQYNVFTVTCCTSSSAERGIPMSLDYFIKIVFKIAPYIVNVTVFDPNVRDVLLGYIPENKIIYIDRDSGSGISIENGNEGENGAGFGGGLAGGGGRF